MSQEPVRVSPLIRTARWSLLIAGIFYGLANKKRLSNREVKIREIEAEEKVIRDAVLAEERKKSAENEALALAMLSKPASPSH